jgi:hypothetical protein
MMENVKRIGAGNANECRPEQADTLTPGTIKIIEQTKG